MIKKNFIYLAILSFFLFFVGLIFTILYFSPAYIYEQIISGKSSFSFYTLPLSFENPKDKFYFNPIVLSIPQKEKDEKSLAHLWKSFRIHSYSIMLPYKHPQIQVNPLVFGNPHNNLTRIGVQFLNNQQKPLLSMSILPPFAFSKGEQRQKLFSTPFAFHIIEKLSGQELFKEIFTRQIITKKEDIYKSHWMDLFLNLYILDLRQHYFPKPPKKLIFISSLNIGIQELKESDGSMLSNNTVPSEEEEALSLAKGDLTLNLGNIDKIYYLDKGLIYSYTLITSRAYEKQEGFTEDLRQHFIRTTSFTGIPDEKSPSTQKEVEDLYLAFKNLPRNEQYDQTGMYYLFSAWSLKMSDEDFLKNLIRQIERNKGNFGKLQFLYDYAFMKYGSNFSTSNSDEKESPEDKLRKGIKKEDENSDEYMKNYELKTPDENPDTMSFSSNEERIKHNLKRIKKEENKEEKKEEIKSLRFD